MILACALRSFSRFLTDVSSSGDRIMRNIGQQTWTGATIAFALFVQPITAFAGNAQPPIPVSEPETLALLAIGAAAVIVARWSRRK
jgi:PEP-CTERM motif-containing protein